MRFWITGASGMLGQAACAVLVERGIAHIGTDREVDVTDLAALEAFALREPFSHVINCAAFTGVDACETDEAEASRVNADGPMHVARVARSRGAVAIHVSTNYVFDGASELPYTELDATNPINAYGRTKVAGEQHFLAEGPELAAYVVRTSCLFGGTGCFVGVMLALMNRNAETQVVDEQTMRPTYAPDLAAALVDSALRTPVRGIYHFANSGEVTWYGLALAARTGWITREMGNLGILTPVTNAEYRTLARRPRWAVLGTDKLERVLAHEPRSWQAALSVHLDAIMQEIVALMQ